MGEQRSSLEELDFRVHDAIAQMELLGMVVQSLDRRTCPRTAALGRIVLRQGTTPIESDLLGLDRNGLNCAITRSVGLHPGTVVVAQVPFAGGEQQLEAEVTDRNSTSGRDHLVLRFTRPSPEQLAVIDREMALLLADD
jgi:hypothetical protein